MNYLLRVTRTELSTMIENLQGVDEALRNKLANIYNSKQKEEN